MINKEKKENLKKMKGNFLFFRFEDESNRIRKRKYSIVFVI